VNPVRNRRNKPNQASDFSDVEARRSERTSRSMTPGRRIGYAIGLPLARALLWLLNATYRVRLVSGADVAERMIADPGRPCVPCYWHQQHIVCAYLIRKWLRRGFRAAYIVSASVDGEVPARIARSWGAEVIRGSAADTGALVLRDALKVMKRGVSIVTTSDGPRGPRFVFKTGTVLMAKAGNAPLVPIACGADRAWYMDTWDEFMIPKPFARIAIAIGEPIDVPRSATMEDMEAIREQMQTALEKLVQESSAAAVDAT
jgi:lysophospholipid acyltransferase (LPLAT)-like uncharacterized protein